MAAPSESGVASTTGGADMSEAKKSALSAAFGDSDDDEDLDDRPAASRRADDSNDAEDRARREKIERLKQLSQKAAASKAAERGKDDSEKKKKKKKRDREEDDGGKRRKRKEEGGKNSKSGSSSKSGRKESGEDMWASVVGESDEDDAEPARTREDDDFIDDTGVQKADYSDDDDDDRIGRAEEAEEADDEETEEQASKQKSSKKRVSEEEQRELNKRRVEGLLYKMEVAADEDVQAHKRKEPAVNKLLLLSEMTADLRNRRLQELFIENGVLDVLRMWIEPMPDKSLPSIDVRRAVLEVLKDLPINMLDESHKDKLKSSQVGKVVLFLSKLPIEIPSNRHIAQQIVQQWSRPLFQLSTDYERLTRETEDEDIMERQRGKTSLAKLREAQVYKAKKEAEARAKKDKQALVEGLEADDGGDAEKDPGEEEDYFEAREKVKETVLLRTRMPRPSDMDFVIMPKDNIEVDLDDKKRDGGGKRAKMMKSLQKIRQNKRQNYKAEKISVEGRGLVTYI